MLGTSREALSAMEKTAAGFAPTAASELLACARLLSSDKALRVAVADSGQPAAKRQALVGDLLGNKVSAPVLSVLNVAASNRWADADDIVEAIEAVAAKVAFENASQSGTLDSMEEEIFRFTRAAADNPELQMALTNPALPAAVKSSIVTELLTGKTNGQTVELVSHVASNLRGRRVDEALGTLSEQAAAVRGRLVAEVRVAIALSAEQSARLSAVLGRLASKAVSLNVIVDPSVIGGVSVRLGEELFDGSVKTRLDQARRALVG